MKKLILLAAASLLVVCLSLSQNENSFAANNEGPSLSGSTRAGGEAHLVFLPVVRTPRLFVVNSMADLDDAVLGDGQCETSPGNQTCTLRAAVQEANACAGPDTISLPPGLYKLTKAGTLEDNAFTGDLDILEDLTLIGAGQDVAIIDGNELDRVFHILEGRVVLSGVAIRRGFLTGDGGAIHNSSQGKLTVDSSKVVNSVAATGFGGGIESRGPLTVTNSIISANHAVRGGGIYQKGPVFTIENSTVSSNVIEGSSTVAGGGIHINNSKTLFQNVLVENNMAIPATTILGGGVYLDAFYDVTIANTTIRNHTVDGGKGAGMYIDGTLNSLITISNSVIDNNHTIGSVSSANGGGVFNKSDGIVEFSAVTFSNNYASYDGGGLYYQPDSYVDGQLNIKHSTFYLNTAGQGAGLSQDRSNVLIMNSTFDSNSASTGHNNRCGAIGNRNGELLILNSTIVNNEALYYGGGICKLVGYGQTVLQNTIIAFNDATSPLPASGNNCYWETAGDLVSAGYNIENETTCPLVAAGDLPNTNPDLGPLGNNGGATLTHALLPGSPAVDAGLNSACPSIDQRGVPRPLDGDGDTVAVCDIGSFERQP